MHTIEEIKRDIEDGFLCVIGCLADDPDRRHIEGSTPSPCAECARAVILSPATRSMMTGRSHVLCLECASRVAESRNQPFINPGRTPEQLEEMKANGLDPVRSLAAPAIAVAVELN